MRLSRSYSAGTIAVLFLLTLGAAQLVFSQSYRGAIRGTVTDKTGAVIGGAQIAVESAATGLKRSTATADDGSYSFVELSAGDYTITSVMKGFQMTTVHVVVVAGGNTTADILQILGSSSAVLNIEDTLPVIESSRDILGQVVEAKLVAELPINGRDFTKLVALTPGATVEPSGVAGTQGGFGQFNINGSRDRSNNYTLDGTDNNDPFFNNSALNQVGITGAPASLLPIDAIAEFNLQSQFGAEYGRNSGSVVNIITKSGTNRLHGSAFEFHRNSALDARNYFNTVGKQTHFVNNNFGGALGGPIVHDKTFFFAAYEGQRERVGSDFNLLYPQLLRLRRREASRWTMGWRPSTRHSTRYSPFILPARPELYPVW